MRHGKGKKHQMNIPHIKTMIVVLFGRCALDTAVDIIQSSIVSPPCNHNTNLLTFIILVSHDLASSVIKADCQARAVWLNVALCPCIPMDPCNADGTSHVVKTAECHLHLQRNNDLNVCIAGCLLYTLQNCPHVLISENMRKLIGTCTFMNYCTGAIYLTMAWNYIW